MPTLNDNIKAMYEAQKALREATKKVLKSEPVLGYNQWMFAVHSHYEEPRVSAWDKGHGVGEGLKEPVTFIMNDDGWQILRIGGYVDDEQSVEAAFRSWLAMGAKYD